MSIIQTLDQTLLTSNLSKDMESYLQTKKLKFVDDAIKHFQQIIKLKPKYRDAYLYLTMLYVERANLLLVLYPNQAQFQQASKTCEVKGLNFFKQYFHEKGRFITDYYQLARHVLETTNYTMILNKYESQITKLIQHYTNKFIEGSEEAITHKQDIDTLFQAVYKNYELAENLSTSQLKIAPHLIDQLYQLAGKFSVLFLSYSKKNDGYQEKDGYQSVAKIFKATIRVLKVRLQQPQLACFYYSLGQVLNKADDTVQAESYFTLAISCNTQFIAAYVCRGQIRKMDGHYDLAIQDFNFAIENKEENDPMIAYYSFFRGEVYFKQGNFAEANEDYQVASQLCSDTNAGLQDCINLMLDECNTQIYGGFKSV